MAALQSLPLCVWCPPSLCHCSGLCLPDSLQHQNHQGEPDISYLSQIVPCIGMTRLSVSKTVCEVLVLNSILAVSLDADGAVSHGHCVRADPNQHTTCGIKQPIRIADMECCAIWQTTQGACSFMQWLMAARQASTCGLLSSQGCVCEHRVAAQSVSWQCAWCSHDITSTALHAGLRNDNAEPATQR